MKKLSNILSAAASVMLAATMVAGLQSCSKEDNPASTPQEEVTPGKIIIKEAYFGGCPNDGGKAGMYIYGGYITLYNNGGTPVTTDNLAFGMAIPGNAEASNPSVVDGVLEYENDGFVPAWNGVWYFVNPVTIQPFSEIVVAVNSAIDNTQVQSQSINHANASYYTFYDPASGYEQKNYYPQPTAIPEANWLKAVKYGQGTGWALSTVSPALFVFKTPGAVPSLLTDDNLWYPQTRAQTPVYANQKIKNEWIVDAVEVFNSKKIADSNKRLPVAVDAGYVEHTNGLGHSVYRNVDKEATEALKDNAGKLVYDYALGNDPSGIDAEASIKKGARIVFLDTNNSAADFHERETAALR